MKDENKEFDGDIAEYAFVEPMITKADFEKAYVDLGIPGMTTTPEDEVDQSQYAMGTLRQLHPDIDTDSTYSWSTSIKSDNPTLSISTEHDRRVIPIPEDTFIHLEIHYTSGTIDKIYLNESRYFDFKSRRGWIEYLVYVWERLSHLKGKLR